MKTSFNGLTVVKQGVHHAYDLTPKELESLKRHFGDRVIGSNGNYTVFENPNTRIFIQLFVHKAWKILQFDIRKDLLNLFNTDEISVNTVEQLSKKLFEKRIQVHVNYNWNTNSWSISDYDEFLELLKNSIAEL